MKLFVDTSALFAFSVESDPAHDRVRKFVRLAPESGRPMFTTNYVVVEAIALLQNRVGLEAVRTLEAKLLPLIDILFVDALLHRRALDRMFRIDRRRLSLVDAASFEAMDAQGATEALTLDSDFAAQGYRVVP